MLVSCVAYQQGEKIADIDVAAIHGYLQRPGCFVWVALRDPADDELTQMQQQFGLHELAVEDARHGHQRPKIEEYGDSLFVVVHVIEPAGAELSVGEVAIFAGRNYVLSVRRGAARGFHDVRARSEREPQLLRHGSGYVLYALIDAVVDRYFPVMETLEDELEAVEERILTGHTPRENIQQLYLAKQKLVVLKHAIAPLLEALVKLYGGRVPQICGGMDEYFRDVSDHLVRLNQGIDSIREMVITAISVNLSMIALQESETMKRLAAYAALVAVPTLIVGVYGMNFDFMPELRWKYGYPLVMAVIALVDGLLFLRLRKARWL